MYRCNLHLHTPARYTQQNIPFSLSFFSLSHKRQLHILKPPFYFSTSRGRGLGRRARAQLPEGINHSIQDRKRRPKALGRGLTLRDLHCPRPGRLHGQHSRQGNFVRRIDPGARLTIHIFFSVYIRAAHASFRSS